MTNQAPTKRANDASRYRIVRVGAILTMVIGTIIIAISIWYLALIIPFALRYPGVVYRETFWIRAGEAVVAVIGGGLLLRYSVISLRSLRGRART